MSIRVKRWKEALCWAGEVVSLCIGVGGLTLVLLLLIYWAITEWRL